MTSTLDKSPATTTTQRRNLRHSLPLVATLNCIEDCSFEKTSLAGIAEVEHVPLSSIAEGKIESATAVIVQSLVHLPRAAQRRLRSHQLILCLGAADNAAESALAVDLGLHIVHVDTSRAEEIADTVMALFLGLLRRTHVLSCHSALSSAWMGTLQPLCRGMRRCRGLVLGIVGRSASARHLAIRSLAFLMTVIYFDVHEGKGNTSSIKLPPAARRMDTLNDLLSASDLISLHCSLTRETIQIINAECLRHIKPGAFLVNTSSSQLLDDCALKQLLIDGTLAGCALDGAEGPQWMEAWVREMPNVLILPRSADYSDEVWVEIREKGMLLLQSFLCDGIVPKDDTSDDEERDGGNERWLCSSRDEELAAQSSVIDQRADSGMSQSKKPKKRHGHQRPAPPLDPPPPHEEEDGSAMGSTVPTPCPPAELVRESTARVQLSKSGKNLPASSGELLKDGHVVVLYSTDARKLFISRKQAKDSGWFLDLSSNVTKRDPAAQFLLVKNRNMIGLRSFAAGGRLLQVNGATEFVFTSHVFDVWESWKMEGSLEDCRLVNCGNPLAVRHVRFEILAAIGEDDGIMRLIG